MSQNKKLSLSLKGPFKAKDIRAFQFYKFIDELSLTDQKVVTVEIAKGFSSIQSVRNLRLWCSITRTAMRYIINIPDLEQLYILDFRHPGFLENFSSISSLKDFYCNYSLSEKDLLEISKSLSIQKLSAQGALLTPFALDSLLQMPVLNYLDIEGTEFSDNMANTLSLSSGIKKLRICNNPISAKGLKSICNMPQLKSLDIWATDIIEKDLALLENLPHLESLSIGNLNEQSILSFKGVLPYLQNIPSLKKIWLDGILVTESEKKKLEQHYESVRY